MLAEVVSLDASAQTEPAVPSPTSKLRTNKKRKLNRFIFISSPFNFHLLTNKLYFLKPFHLF